MTDIIDQCSIQIDCIGAFNLGNVVFQVDNGLLNLRRRNRGVTREVIEKEMNSRSYGVANHDAHRGFHHSIELKMAVERR